MDIRHLIDLLPPIFKAQDTYRVNGKGFLERYLEICGNYLTDIITPDIDNILDIIQIDTTPKEYLNYLWEFLGEMPFANIYNVDKDKWDLNYDGTNMNEDIWLIDNNKPIALNDQTARDLIKYSLSLYKIRGTKKFFDTILRLYGMECIITHEDPDYDVVTPYFDTSYVDRDSLDIDYECKQCSNIKISLDDRYHELVFADINGVIVRGSDEKILTGKSLYLLPNYVAEPTKLNFITILTVEDTTRYEVIDTFENSSLEVGPLSGDIVYAEDYSVFGCTNKENTILYIGKWEHISGLSSADYHNYDHPTIFTDLRDGAAQYMWDDNWDLVKYDGSYSTNVQFFNLKDLVIAYNNYEGNIDFSNLSILPSDVRMFVSLRRLFESFFDRFTPYNANITLEYDGIAPDDNIEFNVLYEDPDNSIITNDHPTVNLKLVTNGKWPVFDNRYQVSGNTTDWSGEYHTSQIHVVTSPGTYYFKLLSTGAIVPITVGISKIIEPYSLQLDKSSVIYLSDYPGNIATITPNATLGSTRLSTTVVLPSGSTTEIEPGDSFTVDTQGVYKVYITNYPTLYKQVYVYLKPIESKTSLVDIPYGVEVTIQHGLDGDGHPIVETYGTRFDENTDPKPLAIVESTLDGTYGDRKVLSIVPWVVDPNDPSKVLRGEDFIRHPDFAVSLAIMDSEQSKNDKAAAYTQAINSGGVSSERAVDYINNLINTSSHSVSVMVTILQLNISYYYDPYKITDPTGVSDGGNMYLHNPMIINIVVPSNGDQPMVGGSKFIRTNEVPGTNDLALTAKGYSDTDQQRDVLLMGAILLDNTRYIYLPVYGSSNQSYQDYPYYSYRLKLSPNQTKRLDISGLKLKDPYGVTIYRTVVAFELDNFGVTNVPEIIISDIQDDTGNTDGLTMSMYTEYDTKIYPSGLGGLEIKLDDGTSITITRRYIVKLNNNTGLSQAKFKFQLIIGGIVFNDDNLPGGVVVDLDGNTYNTKLPYTERRVRFYDETKGTVNGNHGYIFTVRGFGDNPDYNIMLDIVIDQEASDSDTMVFNMVPEDFYLPVNGKSAITNILVGRPYTFYNGLGSYVMYQDDNTGKVISDTPLEYRVSTSSSSQKLFTALGTGVEPIEKTFNIIKNN